MHTALAKIEGKSTKKKHCSKPFIIKKKNPTMYLPVNIYKFCFVIKFFRFWGIFLRFYIYQLILAAHNKTAVWLLSAEIIKGFLTETKIYSSNSSKSITSSQTVK